MICADAKDWELRPRPPADDIVVGVWSPRSGLATLHRSTCKSLNQSPAQTQASNPRHSRLSISELHYDPAEMAWAAYHRHHNNHADPGQIGFCQKCLVREVQS